MANSSNYFLTLSRAEALSFISTMLFSDIYAIGQPPLYHIGRKAHLAISAWSSLQQYR